MPHTGWIGTVTGIKDDGIVAWVKFEKLSLTVENDEVDEVKHD
jgi:hypothetical protein